MKTRNNFLKGIMSMLLGSCVAVSLFANAGMEVSADTTETVYIDENFDEYTTGTIIQAGKEEQEPILFGKMTYSVANRTGGMNCNASIKSGSESGNYLYIDSDSYATAKRGVSFAFNYDATLPTADDMKASGTILELSMDVNGTSGAFGLTGFTTGYNEKNADYRYYDEGTYVPAGTNGQVRAIFDAVNMKKYLIITDKAGQLVNSYSTDLATVDFTGASFWLGNTDVSIDNIKVVEKSVDVAPVTFTVTANGEALAEATVTVEGITLTTDENGTATVVLPNGTYSVEATKAGYEATVGGRDAAKAEVTVNSVEQTVDMTLLMQSYTKYPAVVTVGGGQGFIAAPKDADTATTVAFTTSVLDQMEVDMTSDEYKVAWNIYPTGTTTADANVTIDQNGVVSVSKEFHTEAKAVAYDVVAEAIANGESASATTTIYVGNSDVFYYENVKWETVYGDRGNTKNLVSAVPLADVTDVVLNVDWLTVPKDQTMIALVTNAGNLTGIQYFKDKTVNAWTVWNSDTYNQWDDTGVNNGLIASNVGNVEVTFTIDKNKKTIIATCGENIVKLPYTMDANTLTGLMYGKTYDGNFRINDILIKEGTIYIEEPSAEIVNYNVSLSDQIDLKFHMSLNDAVLEAENAYVFIEGPDSSKTINVSEATQDTNGNYVFAYPVAAKQMTDTITARVVVDDEEIAVYPYSVREYAVDLIENQDADENTIKLVKAMLNYGAYAQKYFNYNTGNLANVDYADTSLDVTGAKLAGYKPVVEGSAEGITYAGSTLLLEDAVKFRHYFAVSEGAVVPASLTKLNDTTYYYESAGFKASELGKTISYTDVTGYSIAYSPLSYVTTVLANGNGAFNDKQNLQDVLKAMYLYYAAVQALQ